MVSLKEQLHRDEEVKKIQNASSSYNNVQQAFARQKVYRGINRANLSEQAGSQDHEFLNKLLGESPSKIVRDESGKVKEVSFGEKSYQRLYERKGEVMQDSTFYERRVFFDNELPVKDVTYQVGEERSHGSVYRDVFPKSTVEFSNGKPMVYTESVVQRGTDVLPIKSVRFDNSGQPVSMVERVWGPGQRAMQTVETDYVQGMVKFTPEQYYGIDFQNFNRPDKRDITLHTFTNQTFQGINKQQALSKSQTGKITSFNPFTGGTSVGGKTIAQGGFSGLQARNLYVNGVNAELYMNKVPKVISSGLLQQEFGSNVLKTRSGKNVPFGSVKNVSYSSAREFMFKQQDERGIKPKLFRVF